MEELARLILQEYQQLDTFTSVLLVILGVISIGATAAFLAASRRLRQLGDSLAAKNRELAELHLVPGQLRDRSVVLESMLDSAGVAIFRTDLDGCITHANRRTSELFKYTPASLETLKSFDLLPLRDREEARASYQRMAAGEIEQVEGERLYRRSDNTRFWGSVIVRRILAVDGRAGIVHVVADVSGRRTSDDALRLTNQVLHAISNGVVVLDPDMRVIDVNPAFRKITGRALAEVQDRPLKSLATDQQTETFYSTICRKINMSDHWEGELMHRRVTGEDYRLAMSVSAVRDERSRLIGYVAVFRDITQQHRIEKRIRLLAFHDPMTRLPNRLNFVQRAGDALQLAKRHGRRMACLFIDLDRFKSINDQHGHAAGDLVLKTVAGRLRNSVRASDIVCRFGGDEFVVLLPEVASAEGLLSLAEKLLQRIEEPCDFDGQVLEVSACIGIAVFPDHGDDVDSLIRRADEAMYDAKPDASQRICLAKSRADTGAATK